MMCEPNASQKQLLDLLMQWHIKKDKPIFVYSGPPGSGKTWVIRLFFEKLGITPDEFVTCAFAGKAVTVLARNGLPAKTIHSLIYYPVFKKIETEDGKFHYEFTFVKKESLDPKLKYIVVDELSMVNDTIMHDLLSFGIPVIGMGDINQLPPGFGESSFMLRPDFCLNEIMRQVKDSPIIKLSQMVLHDEPLLYGSYGNCNVLRNMKLDDSIIKNYDMILCGKNTTRDFINSFVRHNIYGIKTDDPVIMDKVVCKQNEWDRCVNDMYLTNGTVGYINDIFEESVNDKRATIDFTPEYNRKSVYYNVDMDLKYITSPYETRKEMGFTKFTKFEYAYAITTHSSQGSEYDRILYIDEAIGGGRDKIKKLKYTAISRAVNQIDIVNGYNLLNYYLN